MPEPNHFRRLAKMVAWRPQANLCQDAGLNGRVDVGIGWRENRARQQIPEKKKDRPRVTGAVLLTAETLPLDLRDRDAGHLAAAHRHHRPVIRADPDTRKILFGLDLTTALIDFEVST